MSAAALKNLSHRFSADPRVGHAAVGRSNEAELAVISRLGPRRPHGIAAVILPSVQKHEPPWREQVILPTLKNQKKQ